MWQRHFYFLVVWVLGFYVNVDGQKNTPEGEIITGFSTDMTLNTSLEWSYGKFQFFPSPYSKKPTQLRVINFGGNQTQLPFLGSSSILHTTGLKRDIQKVSGGFSVLPLFRISDIYKTTPLSPFLEQLGFFCKKEVQLDRLTPMPVRFRLGSMEYVNWLEQKPNSRRY